MKRNGLDSRLRGNDGGTFRFTFHVLRFTIDDSRFTPETRERLGTMGFDVVAGSPEAFAAVIRDNNARLGKVIREAGIRAE